MDTITARILKVVPNTVVDGPGVRTSVYFAGCGHHCEGCHNPESWDMLGGSEYTLDQLFSEIRKVTINPLDAKVTLTGGDPLFQSGFVNSFLTYCDFSSSERWNVWLYTGFTFEELQSLFSDILDHISLTGIVCDPFVLKLRDTENYLYRGSSNQRIFVKDPNTDRKWHLWEY